MSGPALPRRATPRRCLGGGAASPAGIAPSDFAAGEEETLLAPLPLAGLAPRRRSDPQLGKCRPAHSGRDPVGAARAAGAPFRPRAPDAARPGARPARGGDLAAPAGAASVGRAALAEPIMLSEEIESLVGLLAGDLEEGSRAAGRRCAPSAACFVSRRRRGQPHRVGTSRPLREPRLIKRLFHERLAALGSEIDAGFGFELVRLSALAVAPFEIEQTDLSGRANDDGEALALFADRVRARLGREAARRAGSGRQPSA